MCSLDPNKVRSLDMDHEEIPDGEHNGATVREDPLHDPYVFRVETSVLPIKVSHANSLARGQCRFHVGLVLQASRHATVST
jgi:hypothetical protein